MDVRTIGICTLTAASAGLALWMPAAVQGGSPPGFSAGSLVVVRVGDGSAALTNAATAVVLEERSSISGSVLSSVPMPTAVNAPQRRLDVSGSATSEGFLTLSADGQYLVMGGYDAALGTASVATTTGATVNRVVGRITVATKAVDTSTATTDFSGNNIRSATTDDGSRFWVAGASGGVRYISALGNTSSIAINSTAPTNLRVLNIFNGQLHFSSNSGAFLGVGTVGTGLPTTTGQTLTQLPGLPTTGTHSTYDYYFPNPNTLYLADDGSTANGGGIQRWDFNGSSWTLAYTLQNGTTPGVRGLTGLVDQSTGRAVLYATTIESSANRIVRVIDSGPGSSFINIATAATNTAFRGIRYIPGQCANLTVDSTIGPGSVTEGGQATFSVNVSGTPPYLYQWRRGLTPLADGGKYSGTATATLTINPVDLADTGNDYNCVVGNGCSSATSGNIALTVTPACIPPTIRMQPTSQIADLGGAATFTVSATGSALDYQWRRGTTELVDDVNISGAHTDTLHLTNLTHDDADTNYNCVVSNTCGSQTTDPASLTVNGEICTGLGINRPLPVTAPLGGAAVFVVSATGTDPITYQWRRGRTPLVDGGNILGSTTNNLVISPVGLDDAGTDYNCVIVNPCDSFTTSDVSLNVLCDDAQITGTSALSITVDLDGTALFSVTASGSGPLSYQWRRGTSDLNDGGQIVGAHTSTLMINHVTPADAASNYNCVVSNPCNSQTSRNFTLAVHLPCPADISPVGGDGVVNIDDLLTIINHWGPCMGKCPAFWGDITHDDVVNIDDLLAVINAWGACPR